MLIQNVTPNLVPAPAAIRGNAGTPDVAVLAHATASATLDLPQTAVPPVAEAQAAQATNAQAHGNAQPGDAQLKAAIDKMNQAMQQSNINLEFSIDRDSHRTLVKVVDSQTGETIKQFPSKEVLAISQAIDQFQKGSLFKQKA